MCKNSFQEGVSTHTLWWNSNLILSNCTNSLVSPNEQLRWKKSALSVLLDELARCHAVSVKSSAKSPIHRTYLRIIPDRHITEGRSFSGTSDITEILTGMSRFSLESSSYTHVGGNKALRSRVRSGTSSRRVSLVIRHPSTATGCVSERLTTIFD